MLRLMREKAGNWLIKVLLGAIVIVFVFWGVGSFSNKGGGKVALVNGEPITVEEYRKAYNDIMEQLRQSFGNNLNDEMLKMLNVRKQALDRIVDKRLLLSEASNLNFRVSKKELADTIKRIGAFQRAGVFSNRLYQAVLNQNRLSPEQFELRQSELMLVEKLKLFITSSIKVSDKEAREWYNWSNTSVGIDFVLFEPGRYKNINPSSEEIAAYYDTHKSAYKTDPLTKARYLHFKPEAYTAGITVTEEEIRDYYEANPEQFKTPKTVEARHILIKVARDADPDAVERARIKSLAIHKMAIEGKDFAELAKQFSEGPSKDKGGHLGTFKKETMVKPFADKAFSMKAGEISEPVRTPFGWHIIKAETINKAVARSLEESTAQIREKMTNDRARNRAYDEAEAIYDVSFEGDDLVKAARASNLKISTTDFFSRKGPDKGITDRAKFASAAMSLPVMGISDIQDFGDGYYLLQVIEKIPEKISELKTVEERVRADLVKDRQEETAKKDAEALLSALKSGESMDKATENFGATPGASGIFKRNEPIPNIGPEREIAQIAFKLSNEKRLPDSAIKGIKGYYVIRLNERKAPDPKGFGKEKAKIRAGLLQQKNSRAFEEYLAQIKKKSEISIEEGFLK